MLLKLPPLAFLLAAALLVYLGFSSYDYYFDGITFAMAVEGAALGGDPRWLFHPHHLAYNSLALAAFRFCQFLGYEGRSLLVMQALSSLSAVLALGLFHKLLRSAGLSSKASLSGTAFLAACYAFWKFGTMSDTTMPAVASQLLMLSIAARPGQPSLRRAAALGFCLAGASLMHITSLLWFPPLVWFLARAFPVGFRLKAFAVFASSLGATLGGTYLAAGYLAMGLNSPLEVFHWARGYLGVDPRLGYEMRYARWGWEPFSGSLRAMGEALVGTGSPLAYGALVLGAGAVGLTLKNTRNQGSSRKRLVEMTALYLAAQSLFFSVWMPEDLHFKTLALPVFCFLVFFGLGTRASKFGPFLALGLGVITVFGPARLEIQADSNVLLSTSQILKLNTEENSTIVISGVGTHGSLKAYVPYFAQRRMLILDWEFAESGLKPSEHLSRLAERVKGLQKVGALYLVSEALHTSLEPHFLKVHGVSLGDIRRHALPKRMEETAVLGSGLKLYALESTTGERL